MAYTHEFFLVPSEALLIEKATWEDVRPITDHPRDDDRSFPQVVLRGELIDYIQDGIGWIRPYKEDGLEGLNLCGTTRLGMEGAQTAAQVFEAYAHLFQASGKELILHGSYCTDPDGTDGYEKLVFDRDEIVSDLLKVAEFFSACKDGSHYVFHCGV